MTDILVIAEHDNATLKGATLNTVTAARKLRRRRPRAGRRLRTPAAAAQAAAQIAGVAKVLHADGDALRRTAWPRTSPRRCSRSRRDYSHILFPATARGKNVAPRVAAKLDVGQISDITKVDSRRHLRAPDLRRQRDRHGAEPATRSRSSRCAPPASTRRRRPAARRRSRRSRAVADSGKSTLRRHARSRRSTAPSSPPPRSSSRGGRALGSSEKFNEVLTPLADKLGAALGASRAAVDAGYAPNDWQVGQTGKIVAPQLYIAAGISRRDPAPGRHEGLARSSSRSTRTRRRRSSASPTTASWPTCSSPCRSWSRRSELAIARPARPIVGRRAVYAVRRALVHRRSTP